ncbi:GDP-mannose 4,6-dehydratase [Spirosoma harenae]
MTAPDNFVNHVLITGGAGFIGSHLADYLLTVGCTVHVLDNFYPNYDPEQKRRNVQPHLTNPAYYLHEGDIRNTTQVEILFQQYPIDVVIHLAALPGVQQSLQRPAEYTDVNVTGTQLLLEAMQKAGIRKLIYGSSSSVYGETAPLPLREDYQTLQPISPYAVTKYQAEQLCRQYHDQYGLEAACLRFFTVYGPRQRPDMAISLFLNALLQHRPITIYGEGTSRDYTYVADIVQGISKAISHINGFEVYNIGGGTHISVRQLIDTMEAVTGQPAIILHQSDRTGDVTHTWADLTKAKQQLGYQPAVSLQEGIANMVRAI